MGEVWPTAHITELCLQLTTGSRPVNGDEHRALGSQSCERALLTMGDLPLFTVRQYDDTTTRVIVIRNNSPAAAATESSLEPLLLLLFTGDHGNR